MERPVAKDWESLGGIVPAREAESEYWLDGMRWLVGRFIVLWFVVGGKLKVGRGMEMKDWIISPAFN